MHLSVQKIHTGQSTVAPNVVGGNPQRNQVFHQSLRVLGQLQNMNYSYTFKVPKKYQRIREGDAWAFVYQSSQIWTDAVQVIYTVEL